MMLWMLNFPALCSGSGLMVTLDGWGPAVPLLEAAPSSGSVL